MTVTSIEAGTAVSAHESSYILASPPRRSPGPDAGLAEGTTARLDVVVDLQGSGTGTLGLDRSALTLRTRVGGAQEIRLTDEAGTTELTQAVELAYVAGPAPE